MPADILICSHPRSGGRWLRFLIAHYLANRHGLGITITPQTVFEVVPDHHEEGARGDPAFAFHGRRSVPLLAVCHQPYAWELHRGYPLVFLARNPYDVVVSTYFHLTREKASFSGTMRELIRHPRLGLSGWIDYVNGWAPKLLTHRDATLLSYRTLESDPARALTLVLDFLGEEPADGWVREAVRSGDALRSEREIRTGQEGNFWDHLQPEEIFDVQAILEREVSPAAVHLLSSIGVEMDPFPRGDG